MEILNTYSIACILHLYFSWIKSIDFPILDTYFYFVSDMHLYAKYRFIESYQLLQSCIFIQIVAFIKCFYVCIGKDADYYIVILFIYA